MARTCRSCDIRITITWKWTSNVFTRGGQWGDDQLTEEGSWRLHRLNHGYIIKPGGGAPIIGTSWGQAEAAQKGLRGNIPSHCGPTFFTTLWARKDIDTTISFLTTMVHELDEDNWGGLRQLLQYIRGKVYRPLILRDVSLNIIIWCLDVPYVVHGYMRDHTGGTISFVKWPVRIMLNKHKINMRISTESEFVVSDYLLPRFLWTQYFVELKGLKFEYSIVYQENLITVML